MRSGSRRLLGLFVAGVAALALLAASASYSRAAELPMGFGVSLLKGGTDRDWLRLGNPSQWETVNGYLVDEQARWVNIRGPWGDLACDHGGGCGIPGHLYTRLRQWVQTAALPPGATTVPFCRKKVLVTIKWIAPPGLRQADTNLPGWGENKGPAAIESMRQTAKNVHSVLHGQAAGDYPGGGTDLTPCVQLEVAPEPNFEGSEGGKVQRPDARLWWDAVNNTAFGSKTNGWTFGQGIVAGGVSTNRNEGGFGTKTVAPYDYLDEAITGSRAGDSWQSKHRDQQYMDAYGIHASHCIIKRADGDSDSTQETKWGCDRGIDERVSDVHRALLDSHTHAGKDMEITALLPSETKTPGHNSGAVTGAAQAAATKYIWNQLRTTVAHYDQNPLDLVVFNHLIDSSQGDAEGYPTAGFMKCSDGGAWNHTKEDDNHGGTARDYCFPWAGKIVFDEAQTWNRTIP